MTPADLALRAAEDAVVGLLLLRPSAAEALRRGGLQPHHLYDGWLSDLWRAIEALTAQGIPASATAVVVSDPTRWAPHMSRLVALGSGACMEGQVASYSSSILGAWRDRQRTIAAQTAASDPAAAAALLRAVDDGVDVFRIDPEAPGGCYLRGDDVELGAHLAAQIGGGSTAVYDEDGWWRAGTDAQWQEVPDAAVRREAQRFAGQLRRGASKKDGEPSQIPIQLSYARTQGIVAVAADVIARPGWFAGRPDGAAFRSTFLRVDGARVVRERLHRDHRIRAAEVSDYEPDDAEPSRWTRFLTETWGDEPDCLARIDYLQEWVGAAILGIATRWKDSPLLVGPKDSGKSRVVEAVLGLFPERSRRSIPLHALSHEYHRAALAGGRINAVGELPAREVLDGEAAKAILSGDPVDARHPAGRVFSLRSRCAHIAAANDLPPALDRALTARFAVLRFRRVVPVEQQDAGLAASLHSERARIAAWGLAGAERLLARGRFLRPASARMEAVEWTQGSDTVASWAAECLTLPGACQTRTSGAALYLHYQGWCRDAGHRIPTSRTTWGRRMTALGYRGAKSSVSMWDAEPLTPDQIIERAEASAQEAGWQH